MDTIASEYSNSEDGMGGGEPCACMFAKRCDANGLPEDGGHIFDHEFEDEPGNAWCGCGMDVITYTCWFSGF